MKTTTTFSKIVRLKKRIRVIQGGTCFVSGTKVLLSSGKKKNIEDIRTGDKVLSFSSNLGTIESEVYDHWKNPADKPIISFCTKNGQIRCTYDHKFYTAEGYKELYKIVWGDMEASQRLQLELLCKQYGQDFDHQSPRGGELFNNEASSKQIEEESIQNTQDCNGRKNSFSSQGCGKNISRKPGESASSRPHKRKPARQQSGKLGLGNELREYEKSLRKRSEASDDRREEPEIKAYRSSSGGDKIRVGRDAQEEQEAAFKRLWGIGGKHKRYLGIQDLQTFAAEQIQIQEPEKTFAISVRNVNYFVGNDNINVSNSAGKTIALLQLIYLIALKSKKPIVISIVSESLPHLKRGAMRDFFKILMGEGVYDVSCHNKTDNYYRVAGSIIEFFSVDQESKVRGSRRDILFMNEANNIHEETFNQLEVRTRGAVFIDYNPTTEFWVHEEVLMHDDAEMVVTTYKDNEYLEDTIIKSIEKRKPVYDAAGNLISGNENWWKVYGLGQTGKLEGVIFPDFEMISGVPEEAKLLGYGLDFGFSSDPAALIAVYFYNGGVILDELIYSTGLTNTDLVKKFRSLQIKRHEVIYADSAEPKSIEEIHRNGFNIQPTIKGKDSIKFGIDLMQNLKISITKRSLSTIKEFRNYSWATDKNGKDLDRPEDENNHAIDAARYIIVMKMRKKIETKVKPSGESTIAGNLMARSF